VGIFSGSCVPKLDLKSGSLFLENQKFQKSSERYGQTAFALTEKDKERQVVERTTRTLRFSEIT